MAEDWGFPPDKGKAFFISYNSTDWKRAAAIAKELKAMGYPVWYDKGLEAGTKHWKQQISESIHNCYAVIVCVTSGIFDREKSYVLNEYDQAAAIDKPVIPVFLDKIRAAEVKDKYKSYVTAWKKLRAVPPVKERPRDRALRIASLIEKQPEIGFSTGNKPKTGRLYAKAALGTALKVAIAAAAVYFAIAYVPSFVTGTIRDRINQNGQTDVDLYSGHTISPVSDKLSAGEYIYYGAYPQRVESDNSDSYKVEPIEWRVLDVRNGKALLITQWLIDCRGYGDIESWLNNESLYSWLNGSFLNEGFSDEERKAISDADDGYRVFCLNTAEAEKYFNGKEDRMAAPTDYAADKNSRVSNNLTLTDGSPTGWWWLSSISEDGFSRVYVYEDGSIDYNGLDPTDDGVCVRPAMWIDLPEPGKSDT